MAMLYVDELGAGLRLTGRRLQVVQDDEVLRTVRLRDLEAIVLFGPIDFTTPAMHAALDQGIPVHFLTTGGRYRGRLAPPDGKNVLIRQAQYRRADDPAFRLSMARIIVRAKLANCRYIIQRHTRNHPSDELEQAERDLERLGPEVDRQPDVGSCLGIEGAGARIYFAALGRMVRREFAFTERTRRPPRDPVNALLSFGYALLTTEIVGALASHGLDPGAGMMHVIEYGRPALALDVLEEFRPTVADRVALNLINNGALVAAHFEADDEGGVRMTEDGRAKYIETYHRIMTNQIAVRGAPERVSFRTILRTQAARMRAAIEGDTPYDPYTPR